MTYDYRAFARRVKARGAKSLRAFASVKSALSTQRRIVLSSMALANSGRPSSSPDRFGPIQRRLELIEKHLCRETERSRMLEVWGVLAAEVTRQHLAREAEDTRRHLAREAEDTRQGIERRTSTLRDRITILQREVDSQVLVCGQLSREVWRQRALSSNCLEEIGKIHRQIEASRRVLEETTDEIRRGTESVAARLSDLTEISSQNSAEIRRQAENIRGLDELVDAVAKIDSNLKELVNRHRATPYMSMPIFGNDISVSKSSDSFDYIGFQDIFRGSEELVRERQRTYLQFIREGLRVIDLGCGRGEFLQLAREAGVLAIGIDRDPDMVKRSLRTGLDVREGDALTFLKEIPAESADVIFSAQFIEHVAFEELNALFVAARRALVPGGLLIAETVNPHSIEALKCFYVDLTHVKPLFPEVLLFLARSAGFSDGRIFYPTGEGFDEQAPWNRGEYALVATA